MFCGWWPKLGHFWEKQVAWLESTWHRCLLGTRMFADKNDLPQEIKGQCLFKLIFSVPNQLKIKALSKTLNGIIIFYTIIWKIKFLEMINTSLLLHQLLVTWPWPKCSHYRMKHSKSKSVSPCLYTGGYLLINVVAPLSPILPFLIPVLTEDRHLLRSPIELAAINMTFCDLKIFKK